MHPHTHLWHGKEPLPLSLASHSQDWGGGAAGVRTMHFPATVSLRVYVRFVWGREVSEYSVLPRPSLQHTLCWQWVCRALCEPV